MRIGSGTRIEEDVTIVGPAVIDDRVRVRRGARLERTICWKDAEIGEDAQLRDTVVGTRYTVEAAAVIVDALVAPDA